MYMAGHLPGVRDRLEGLDGHVKGCLFCLLLMAMVVGWVTGGTWSRLSKAGQVPGDSIEGLVAETKVGLC